MTPPPFHDVAKLVLLPHKETRNRTFFWGGGGEEGGGPLKRMKPFEVVLKQCWLEGIATVIFPERERER